MQTSQRTSGWNVQDVLNLIAAVLLFISPWALRYSGDVMAARTAWISAIVIGVFSIAALSQFAEWEEWVTLVLGVWLIVAPWILGFAAISHAVAAFVILGVIVAVLSASELWMVHHPTAMAK
jgi:quinol-cytochrome oxidoreductase complex cytochrome b subunit